MQAMPIIDAQSIALDLCVYVIVVLFLCSLCEDLHWVVVLFNEISIPVSHNNFMV